MLHAVFSLYCIRACLIPLPSLPLHLSHSCTSHDYAANAGTASGELAAISSSSDESSLVALEPQKNELILPNRPVLLAWPFGRGEETGVENDDLVGVSGVTVGEIGGGILDSRSLILLLKVVVRRLMDSSNFSSSMVLLVRDIR